MFISITREINFKLFSITSRTSKSEIDYSQDEAWQVKNVQSQSKFGNKKFKIFKSSKYFLNFYSDPTVLKSQIPWGDEKHKNIKIMLSYFEILLIFFYVAMNFIESFSSIHQNKFFIGVKIIILIRHFNKKKDFIDVEKL